MVALQHKALRDGGPPIIFLEYLEEWHKNQVHRAARTSGLWISGLGRRTTQDRVASFLDTGGLRPNVQLRESTCAIGYSTRFIDDIPVQHWSGLSLGYGYAFYDTPDQAQAVKDKFNGKIFPDSGNPIAINYTQQRPEENAYVEVL